MAYSMTREDRELLKRQRLVLVRDMKMNEEFFSCLQSTSTLTDDMVEEIMGAATNKSRNGKFLDILPRRGPTAFRDFIYALMESQQPHLARMLDGQLVQQWEAENQQSHNRMPGPPPGPQAGPVAHQAPPPLPSAVYRAQPVQSTPSFNSQSSSEEPLLLLPVDPVDTSSKHITSLVGDTQHVYRMTSKPRGRAVIICNSYFVNQRQRDGASFDITNLCNLFDNLYFKTVVYENLPAQDIKAALQRESELPDHWNACCLVVFILSHGSQGYVYGIDGNRLSIEQDIITPFDGNHCEALVNKPKVFFVQACQGSAVSEGIGGGDTGDNSETDASPTSGNLSPQVLQALRELRLQDNEANISRLVPQTHEKADVVIAYSTVPGYRAWRRADLGSWFVRAIVEVFSERAKDDDLLGLLVAVRKKVSEKRTMHTDHSFIQLTRTDEHTLKKLYFFPGYYETNVGDNV